MANKFPNLLIKIASIFTSCFNTKQSSDCQGIMVPYTGHPVLRIKRASLEHSTRSLSVPRAKTIIVLSNLPRMNAWQLLNGNKYNLNVSQEQILASMPKGTVINRIIEGRDGYEVYSQRSLQNTLQRTMGTRLVLMTLCR